MEDFKVVFPAGYNVQNILNDNIDLNIIMSNGLVFFATFFTISNIQYLLERSDSSYFWSSDMVVVKDLKKETIKLALSELIEDGYLEVSLSKIGKIENVFPGKRLFEEIANSV